MARLTKRQKTFVEEYLIDLNATQAAIRAGYSVETAGVIGSENLKKPNIAEAIGKAMAERSKRTGVNADRIVLELAKMALANPMDVINFEDATIKPDATRDDMTLVAGIKIKVIEGEEGTICEREIKLNDKLKALDLLGKHLGIYQLKVNVNNEADAEKREKLDAIAGILQQMHKVAGDEVAGDADG